MHIENGASLLSTAYRLTTGFVGPLDPTLPG
jgi:hypothetical protein